MSKRILFFANLFFPWFQDPKCPCFAIFNCSKNNRTFSLQDKIIQVDCTKILLGEKNDSNEIIHIRFCCLYVNIATVQILGQSDKFPLSFSSLKCLLQVKNVLGKRALRKKSCLRKNTLNWVLRYLSQSALGKFANLQKKKPVCNVLKTERNRSSVFH